MLISVLLWHLTILRTHIMYLPSSKLFNCIVEMLRRLYRNEAGIKNEFQEAKIVGAK